MDKYEYKLKTGQMLELMEDGAFNKAAEIADSIDWKRVRNTKMLTDVSDIYERNGDYQKSYEVLNIAYHRAEGSRKIIYRLCTLALKTKNVDEAIDYYDDFQQIAPKDPNKFILRYQILRAQRAPIEQQIEALEEFKKAEYIEEWAYELAKRYQEAGMTAECLEECDDLILWFNEGKFVYQAMELKMQYKPLTPSQQEKYDQRYTRMSNETIEMPNVAEYQNEAEPAKDESGEASRAESDEISGEAVQEPEKRESKGRKIGSTMKLDEALKSLLNLGMGEEDKVKDSSSDPVSTDVMFEEDKFKEAIEEIEAVADLDLIDEISNQKGLRELKVDPDLEELLPPDSFPDDPEFNGEKTLEELYADAGAPLEKQDMDTREMGTGVGGDTKILDKETLQTLAGLDSTAGKTGQEPEKPVEKERVEPEKPAEKERVEPEKPAEPVPAGTEEKPAGIIPELDEEVREIIAELDEEARKTIEELEEEEPFEDYHIEIEKSQPADHKDQVEGQMNLLDLMADIEIPEAGEEYEKEKGRTDAPVLPPDIQRMIDEIEGVIPAEEPEKEAAGKKTLYEPEEGPQENMGKVAEQLRVDESSEMFEDYDDVLDEDEYADVLPEHESITDLDEEYPEDIRISFGGEEEESPEEYEEAEFGDIMRDDEAEERFTIEYPEDGSLQPEAPGDSDAGPEYEGGIYAEEGSVYESSAADHKDRAYMEEPVHDRGRAEYEDAAYTEEPAYESSAAEYEDAAYAEEPAYESSAAEYEDAAYAEEPAYESSAAEYEDAAYAEEPAYESSAAEYEDAAYAEEDPGYTDAGAYEEQVYEDAGREFEETVYKRHTYAQDRPEHTGKSVYKGSAEEEFVYEDTYDDTGASYAGGDEGRGSVYENEYEEDNPAAESGYAEESVYEEEPPYESVYEEEPAYERAYEKEPPYERAYKKEPSYEGTYEEEASYEGLYEEETSYEDNDAEGASYEGPYEEEPSYEGVYEEEPSYEGAYGERPSYEGTYGEKPSYEGSYEEELSYEGAYEEEPSYEGAYEEEPSYEGAYEEEPSYEGPYEEELSYEGAYEEEPSYEGAYEEEAVYEGAYEEESFYEGSYEEDAAYEYGYEAGGYEEEPSYEEEPAYAGEYDSEEVYEEDSAYGDEEYYAEDGFEEEEAYDVASVEARLEHEFRPQRRSRRRYDEREVPEEEEEMDILSATTPLSRKETAKMIATGKTAPLPMDEISDALSMSDTGFVVHGRYDLRTQSGIGTRAGLTEEQKKLFSYFVPVRGMSEQLVDVLEQDKNCTNRRGTSNTGNLLIIGNKGNGKTVLAVDVVKAIQKQRNIRQGRVAIVTGDSLNKKKISDIFGKLYGGALIIEKAGKMNEKTVARVNKAMERDTGELLIVLEDQRKPLDRLLTSNREFRRKFTSRLEVPILINDELVTFGQTYAQENGYQIDEMGILALYSRIDMLQREDHAVTIAEVKEVMDEAMEHSQKASAKKLVKRVLGKNRDDSDRIILTEKDFI